MTQISLANPLSRFFDLNDSHLYFIFIFLKFLINKFGKLAYGLIIIHTVHEHSGLSILSHGYFRFYHKIKN